MSPWVALSVESLGSDLGVRRWFERAWDLLRGRPDLALLVEQGEQTGGPYLRVLAPAPVAAELQQLGAAEGYLRVGADPSRPPSGFPPGCFAALRWSGRRDPRPPDPPPRLPPLAPMPSPWGVQAFLLGGEEIRVHLRLAAGGAPSVAWRTLVRVGTHFGLALGGPVEPWDPAGRAHRVALGEWQRRELRRFHSGAAPGPDRSRFASAWSAPSGAGPPGPSRLYPRTEGSWAWGWSDAQPWVPTPSSLLRHTLVVGLTGSGKSRFLTHAALQTFRGGTPLVVLDLHGDLVPALRSSLSRPEEARRVCVIGIGGEREEGVDVLSADAAGPERLVPEVLAALRPGGWGREEYWGPRMERLLEGGLRCVLAGGGDLRDLAELFHDPFRHAPEWRAGIPSGPLQDFLSELVHWQRRQPEFLASVQNRLSRVLFDGRVRALVAPRTPAQSFDERLSRGLSLLLRLPRGELGEGASLFVANLLLARTYLALSREPASGEERLRALLVLDEAQLLSPTLLASIVEGGRKFGVAALLATQGGGSIRAQRESGPWSDIGSVWMLRMAPEPARELLGWIAPELALAPSSAAAREFLASMVELPPGRSWFRPWGARTPMMMVLPDRPAPGAPAPPLAPPPEGAPRGEPPGPAGLEGSERLEEQQGLLSLLRGWKPDRIAPPWWPRALQRRYAVPQGDGYRLSEAGWARLGWSGETGAVRESHEHRRLLRDVFALFAYSGVALELPQQGGFDRRLPDARLLLTPAGSLPPPPWAKPPLHVEVEVTSLEDPRRLERSLEKAREAGARLLWVTGRPKGAGRLRSFLRRRQRDPTPVAVWSLTEERMRRWRERHPSPSLTTAP